MLDQFYRYDLSGVGWQLCLLCIVSHNTFIVWSVLATLRFGIKSLPVFICRYSVHFSKNWAVPQTAHRRAKRTKGTQFLQ